MNAYANLAKGPDPTDIPLFVVEPDSTKRLYLSGLFGRANTAATIREVPIDQAAVFLLGPSFASDPKALDVAEMLLISSPDICAVLVTPGESVPVDMMRWGMRANVKDVVAYEGPSDELRSAVHRARQILSASLGQRVAASAPPPLLGETDGSEGKVIAVFAPKGGVGKSTISTNLAVHLALHGGEGNVALLDGDLQFGDVGIMLRIQSQQNVVSIMESKDRIIPSTYNYACATHSSGLRVLPAPADPAQSDRVDPQNIVDVIGAMRQFARILVIDTSPVFDELTILILEQADHILMPVVPDLPTVKNVAIGLRTLKALGIRESQVGLVLNRTNRKVPGEQREVEKTLGLKVIGVIPDDEAVKTAVNDATPVVMHNPRAPVAKAFADLAALYDPQNARKSDKATK